MKHYSKEAWSDYVQGKLSTENQREYQEHLYECDACLQIYTDCITLLEFDPAITASMPSDLNEAFIEHIMVRIESEKELLHKHSNPPRKAALYQKPVFQYALAAAITIILMTTGIFQGITGSSERQPLDANQTLNASYTDQLMDKTVAMMDTLQLKIEKGGMKHE